MDAKVLEIRVCTLFTRAFCVTVFTVAMVWKPSLSISTFLGLGAHCFYLSVLQTTTLWPKGLQVEEMIGFCPFDFLYHHIIVFIDKESIARKITIKIHVNQDSCKVVFILILSSQSTLIIELGVLAIFFKLCCSSILILISIIALCRNN